MSKMSMRFLTETPFIIGVLVSILALIIGFSTLKPNKRHLVGMKNWIAREKWQGETTTATLLSWSRIDSKSGDDFFYFFHFTIILDEREKKKSAVALVKPNDIHKLMKGLVLTIKYQREPSEKFVVMDIHFNG